MLQVGDKVRYNNEYIAKHNFLAPGQRKGRNPLKRRRGTQKIMTVLHVKRGVWDWRTKKYTGDLVLVDSNNYWINSYWLKFIRRDT